MKPLVVLRFLKTLIKRPRSDTPSTIRCSQTPPTQLSDNHLMTPTQSDKASEPSIGTMHCAIWTLQRLVKCRKSCIHSYKDQCNVQNRTLKAQFIEFSEDALSAVDHLRPIYHIIFISIWGLIGLNVHCVKWMEMKLSSKQASKRTPSNRHEETEKWNEMKDE